MLCYAGAECSSAQLAAFDLFEVQQAAHAGFPGARILVCRDRAVWADGPRALTWDCVGGAGAPIVIKLGWRAREGAETAEAPFAPTIAIAAAGAFE